MNEVLVIGNTYQSEIISIKESLSANKSFNSHIYDFLTGGDYTVAYNLAVLGVNTYFITRLGFDQQANSLFQKFDDVNGMLYSNNRLLSYTPKKVYIVDDKNVTTSFGDIPFDCNPDITDGLPSEYFTNRDYAIVNIINSNYLAAILHYYPEIRYICNNNIPSDDLLDKIEGIILDVDYVNQIIYREVDYVDLAKELISKGVKYVIITNKGKGVHVYVEGQNNYIDKENAGDMTIGTHEAFVSMFVACLSNGMNFSESLTYGLNLSNDMSFEESIDLIR